MPETEGLVTLSASGGGQVASETDRAKRGLDSITQAHDRFRGSAEKGINIRNFRLLSTALGEVTGGGGMAAGAVRELIYVVETGGAAFASMSNVIGLVVAAVSVAVGAFLGYKRAQEAAAKAVQASWKEHAQLIAKIEEAERAGVRFTGVLGDYTRALREQARVENEQVIESLKKSIAAEEEYAKKIRYVVDTSKIRNQNMTGMIGIAAELTRITREGTSEYSRMTKAEKAAADARAAQLTKDRAELEYRIKKGKDINQGIEDTTKVQLALRKSQDDLRASQLDLLAVDPEKRSLAASLKIMDQVEKKYDELRKAGVDSATARAQAEAWGANQMKLQWFQNMSQVQDLLTTGFKGAFLEIGHGIDGMQRAFESFRNAVIDMIAEMAAKALAFQVISSLGGIIGGPAGTAVTAAFSTVAQHGAEIPGPWGQPRIVLAHAGENISAPSGRGSAPSSRSRGVTEEHIHFHQGVLDSSAVRQVVRNTKRAQGSLGEKRF